jgi:hypothetical protein
MAPPQHLLVVSVYCKPPSVVLVDGNTQGGSEELLALVPTDAIVRSTAGSPNGMGDCLLLAVLLCDVIRFTDYESL